MARPTGLRRLVERSRNLDERVLGPSVGGPKGYVRAMVPRNSVWSWLLGWVVPVVAVALLWHGAGSSGEQAVTWVGAIALGVFLVGIVRVASHLVTSRKH